MFGLKADNEISPAYLEMLMEEKNGKSRRYFKFMLFNLYITRLNLSFSIMLFVAPRWLHIDVGLLLVRSGLRKEIKTIEGFSLDLLHIQVWLTLAGVSSNSKEAQPSRRASGVRRAPIWDVDESGNSSQPVRRGSQSQGEGLYYDVVGGIFGSLGSAAQETSKVYSSKRIRFSPKLHKYSLSSSYDTAELFQRGIK